MEGVYKVAGIDVHKRMLAVVVSQLSEPGELIFEERKFGAGSSELDRLAAWLKEQGVNEVVMESTAQYWRPVWHALEPICELHLAQAQSNRAPKGRKRDFEDARRLVRRFIAGELILSFVPDAEQRLWRLLTRTRHQLTRDRIRLRNQIEAFLEESRIKLSSQVSDLLGMSGKAMLDALAEGNSDPDSIAALRRRGLRATPEQLADALRAASTLTPLRREILQLFLKRLELIDEQRETLSKRAAEALREHQSAITRLAKTPGLGVDSSQQIVAEIGPRAAKFDSPEQLSSWVGCCPGREESANESKSDRSPKGNRQMRRILNQAANAAVKAKGSVFQELYRRLVPRLGHAKAIWAVAHKLCLITWKILHEGVEYQERGHNPDPRTIKRRIDKMIRHLRSLGYEVKPSAE